MIDWIKRHHIGVLAWALGISWLFHIYLLTGATVRGDSEARNWELCVVIAHTLLLLGLCLLTINNKRRSDDGPL